MTWLVLANLAMAVEPPWRWVTTDHGLVSEHVDDLAQAPDGFLWVATHAGVYRWDGVRAERLDGGVLNNEVIRLIVDRDGVGYARLSNGYAYRIADGSAMALLDEAGAAARVVDLELDPQGRAWVVRDGARRITGSSWEGDPAFDLPPGTRTLRSGPHDWMAGTHEGWYRVGPGRSPSRVADAALGVDAAPEPDGAWWVTEVGGPGGARVRRISPQGEVWASEPYASRGMSITVREGAVWAAFAGLLARIDPGSRRAQVWGPGRGLVTGGPLLVDHEGTLWIGTFRGLASLADPDAALYDGRDGLVGDAHRFVTTARGQIWATSWAGVNVGDPAEPQFRALEGPYVGNPLCADGAGDLWAVGSDGRDGPPVLVRHRVDGWDRYPLQAASNWREACAPRPDGDVWLTTSEGLWRAGPARTPTLVVGWPDPAIAYAQKAMAVDDRGKPWVVAGLSACHLQDAGWSCESVARGGLPLIDVAVTERGEVWAVQAGEGVRRRAGGAWPLIPASNHLPSRYVLGLRASPAGGTWILGHGVVQRVLDAPETAAGWRVEEQLAAWLGHLVSGAADVEERPDGALWIAHNGGLTHVPPGSRRPPATAPPVTLLDVTVAGRRAAGEPAPVADADTAVTLRFAAASYRAPSLLRYRVRVDDGPWGDTRTSGIVELQGLEPGHHRVEVAASLDGLTWTDPPASASLVVPLPWYGRWEVWIALAAVAGVLLLAVERARAALALRMERLRTRIALDLHDQVGAGLGAIGLLAGLLARPGLPPEAGAEAARRVASTADELGVAMRGIVWSLRPESARLDLLARYLEERARAALPDLDRAGRLVVDAPEARVSLDVDVLRGVQLIGLEALHNVARHAGAGWARLALQPAGGGTWRLVVEDDGKGLGMATAPRLDGGNGLRSMRARAAEMRAAFSIGPRPGGGTRLEVVFRPRRSWLASLWRSR